VHCNAVGVNLISIFISQNKQRREDMHVLLQMSTFSLLKQMLKEILAFQWRNGCPTFKLRRRCLAQGKHVCCFTFVLTKTCFITSVFRRYIVLLILKRSRRDCCCPYLTTASQIVSKTSWSLRWTLQYLATRYHCQSRVVPQAITLRASTPYRLLETNTWRVACTACGKKHFLKRTSDER